MTSIGFKIDGYEFNIFVRDIKRSFQVLDGDNAGRVLSGSMERDIVGTYYNYTMVLDAENLSLNDYDTLYEILSAPVDSHKIVIPYAQGTLSFDAYVTTGTDTLKISKNSFGILENHWSDLSIQFIAMDPLRT